MKNKIMNNTTTTQDKIVKGTFLGSLLILEPTVIAGVNSHYVRCSCGKLTVVPDVYLEDELITECLDCCNKESHKALYKENFENDFLISLESYYNSCSQLYKFQHTKTPFENTLVGSKGNILKKHLKNELKKIAVKDKLFHSAVGDFRILEKVPDCDITDCHYGRCICDKLVIIPDSLLCDSDNDNMGFTCCTSCMSDKGKKDFHKKFKKVYGMTYPQFKNKYSITGNTNTVVTPSEAVEHAISELSMNDIRKQVTAYTGSKSVSLAKKYLGDYLEA